MKGFNNRLSSLENALPGNSSRWHRILQSVGQSEEEARSVYEVINGLIPECDNMVYRRLMAA